MPTKKKAAPRKPPRSIADPIFAAIENHEKLDKTDMEMSRAYDEGRVTQGDVDRAGTAAVQAAWAMAESEPTTAAGASAFLTYITTRPLTGLFELGETDWHETAFRTAVDSLSRIAKRAA
jgi:hypothetical protein